MKVTLKITTNTEIGHLTWWAENQGADTPVTPPEGFKEWADAIVFQGDWFNTEYTPDIAGVCLADVAELKKLLGGVK